MGYCEKICGKYNNWMFLIFRALVGLMFFLHGWSKFSSGNPNGLMLAAAVIELVVGTGVFLGAFVRGLATLGALQMLVAFFTVHIKSGWNPLTNGGELALMYFAAFLVLMVHGAKKWSLERKLLKKESF